MNQHPNPGPNRSVFLISLIAVVCGPFARVMARTPDWVLNHTSAALPVVDAQMGAVLLYSDTQVSVEPDGTLRRVVRNVYRVLSQRFASESPASAIVSPRSRVINMHAWSIAPNGDSEAVSQSSAIESALPVADGALFNDLRLKLLRNPAVVANGVVASEVETEEKPFALVEEWRFRSTIPVVEAHYELDLPKGWQAKTTWINHAEEPVTMRGPNLMSWTLHEQKAVRLERFMPPVGAVAGGMMVSLIPPTGRDAGFQTWSEMGSWYTGLTRDRLGLTAEIAQKADALTSKESSPLEKARVLAEFVQSDIRYVAIELGLGNYEPHSAGEVFAHQYGDCKDKATLLSTMLKHIGINSYYLIVNSQRGAVAANSPTNMAFNHMVLAISLPPGSGDPHLLAVFNHPELGPLLIFDPTDHLMPFGRLEGALQGGYGLLVHSPGGELIQLPQLPSSANSVERTGHLTLDPNGTLAGDIREVWTGDEAADERGRLRNLTQDAEQEKILKGRLSGYFSSFDILKAQLGNVRDTSRPLEWLYTVEAPNFGKSADNLLILRPRILGADARMFLESNEPRENPVEFAAPLRHIDEFEITIPAGYRVEELPEPVNLATDSVAYHSRMQLQGQTVHYSRSFEIKQLTVPLEKVEELRKLFRSVRNDENRMLVLVRNAA